MNLIRQRLLPALLAWPDGKAWRRAGFVAAIGLPVIGALAFAGDLARFEPVDFGTRWLAIALPLILVPAMGEEILFRALLVPRPDRPLSTAGAVMAVALFVAWHPFQVLTFGPPWAGAFLDPWFLAIVAALGAMLVHIYHVTGSIWPCVLIHWIVVAAWKLLFAGPFA